jgi:hypothetical protein
MVASATRRERDVDNQLSAAGPVHITACPMHAHVLHTAMRGHCNLASARPRVWQISPVDIPCAYQARLLWQMLPLRHAICSHARWPTIRTVLVLHYQWDLQIEHWAHRKTSSVEHASCT